MGVMKRLATAEIFRVNILAPPIVPPRPPEKVGMPAGFSTLWLYCQRENIRFVERDRPSMEDALDEMTFAAGSEPVMGTGHLIAYPIAVLNRWAAAHTVRYGDQGRRKLKMSSRSPKGPLLPFLPY